MISGWSGGMCAYYRSQASSPRGGEERRGGEGGGLLSTDFLLAALQVDDNLPDKCLA